MLLTLRCLFSLCSYNNNISNRHLTTCYIAAIEPAKKILVAVGAAIGAAAGSAALRDRGSKATLDRIDEAFPGSLTNKELVDRVSDKLGKYGYDSKSTLLCTSLCCDEIARVLEADFAKVYGDGCRLGGLAGFPWGGITSFTSMAAHIPDTGTALLLYAPHVGVDVAGRVGTVARGAGYKDSATGPCCDSAVGATRHVTSVWSKDEESFDTPSSAKDAQHVYLCDALMPYAGRLDESPEPMVELPYACYDAQKEMMTKIIEAGCGAIAGDSRVAVLGGIQINTPSGMTDYFLPLSFELYDNKGEKLEDLTL